MDKKICSITVSFNPDARIITQIKNLKKQVNRIIIVDNGSKKKCNIKLFKKKN